MIIHNNSLIIAKSCHRHGGGWLFGDAQTHKRVRTEVLVKEQELYNTRKVNRYDLS